FFAESPFRDGSGDLLASNAYCILHTVYNLSDHYIYKNTSIIVKEIPPGRATLSRVEIGGGFAYD
ncbi:MAG TPA: hypothetical protein VLQ94_02240, partial [Candidatus Binatia bacterium]|nr:hypothetical protein [Candidatus Binatia bacterium]